MTEMLERIGFDQLAAVRQLRDATDQLRSIAYDLTAPEHRHRLRIDTRERVIETTAGPILTWDVTLWSDRPEGLGLYRDDLDA